MPTLIIDNQTITVADGTNLLEAAQQLGIVVPHFCYHRALGEVGACRMCAVHVETEQGVGIQMSCMVTAEDGMIVSVGHPEAVEFRSHISEWLMMNHPHDCPICDEGGECQLQEMTIASGHSRRRFSGKKRTWENQDLGPYIEQEMNRCIQCYRCVRTYRDYFGGDDFGVMGSRQRLFFGRFQPGQLESVFSGNLVDVCPTGVFTDKTFRFKSRSWDLQEAPSICPHCSIGCATIPGARLRELQRIRAGINEQVNGFFICDRGRFSDEFINRPDRPRQPLVYGKPAGWEKSLKRLQLEIGRLQKEHGKDAITCLGSPRASFEANALLKSWAEQNAGYCVYDCKPRRAQTSQALAVGLGNTGRSLEEIRNSDLLLVIGCDPLSEAPMLASAIRQAARQGAEIVHCGPTPVDLTTDALHIPVETAELVATLQGLTSDKGNNPTFASVVNRLATAERPILIGGGEQLGPDGVEALLLAASQLSDDVRRCGVYVALSAPNSFGTGLLAGNDSFEAQLEAIETGKIKGLLCLETDPFADADDPQRVAAALQKLEFLVTLDYRPGKGVDQADILLPTTGPAEHAGMFVNTEGRMQAFAPVMQPGEPLAQTTDGGHPPRSFSLETPGAEPLPATSILASLLQRDTSIAAIRKQLLAEDSRLAGIESLVPGDSGIVISNSSGGES